MTIHTTGRGFTLIEVVVMLAVLAVLAGTMAPYAAQRIQQARVDATEGELESIEDALIAYYRDCRALPSEARGLACLVRDRDGRSGWDGPYVTGRGDVESGIMADAWGDDYTYLLRPDVQGIGVVDYVIISGGQDRTLDSRLRGGRWRLEMDLDIVLVGSTTRVDEGWRERTRTLIDELVDGLERYYLDVETFPPGVDGAAIRHLLTSSAPGWTGPYVAGPASAVTVDAWGADIGVRRCTRVNEENAAGWIVISNGPGPPDARVNGTRWRTGSNDVYAIVIEASLVTALDARRVAETREQLKVIAGEIRSDNPINSPPTGNLTQRDPWGNRYRYLRQSTLSGIVYSRGADEQDDTGDDDDPYVGLMWD